MSLSEFLFNPVNYFLARRGGEEVAARLQAKPSVGSTICCAGLRMTVQAGMSDDLWNWLQSQGWRPLLPKEDRYKLRALPSDAVTALFDASPGRREKCLMAAIRRAESAPATLT
jgi:hypothetical protein